MEILALAGLAGPGNPDERQVVNSLAAVNRKAAARGLLALREEEITALAQRRGEVLRDTGRVEFGSGILPKLVFAFCDSPHISPDGFAAAIDELMACFYHFKNETAETVGDDELLAFMKEHFDGDCQGSVEYLAGTLLENLARGTRFGDATERGERPGGQEAPDDA